ncbi:MAG TPA: hypothetical protein VKT80_02615 [Chloroflexota bacterium]|nr:hypothetical protein [Chloroflexota bacterium]
MKRSRPTRPKPAGVATQATSPSLAQLVRQSRALDPVARRNWLNVLPYLTPDDRRRLESLLRSDTASDPA